MTSAIYETRPSLKEADMQRRTQEVQMLIPTVETVSHRFHFHADLNPLWLTIAQPDKDLSRENMPPDNPTFELNMSARHMPTVIAVPDRKSNTTCLLVTAHEAWAREAQRRSLPIIGVNMLTWEQLRAAHTDAQVLLESLIQATKGLATWEAKSLILSRREMMETLLKAISQPALR
jgi:hypothetical protein